MRNSTHKRLVAAVAACICMVLTGFADNPDRATETSSPRKFHVGTHSVENRWVGQESAVFGENGHGRWRFFMHGVTDGNAVSIDWQAKASRQWFSSGGVQCDAKTSHVYSIRLEGAGSAELDKPVLSLDELKDAAGKTIRFFIWMSGENVGQNGSLAAAAPQVILRAVDPSGQTLAIAGSLFKTRGTFPWFCYYLDMQIPRELFLDGTGSEEAGLWLQLNNPGGGNVAFCAPAWQILQDDAPSYLKGPLPLEFADPVKGSFAPNPDEDELAMHFFFGLPFAQNLRWTFLEQVASLDQLNTFLDDASADWFAMTYAVPYLAKITAIGQKGRQAPQLENGWQELFQKKIAAMQDEATGMWTIDGRPNLFLTQRILSGVYSGKAPATLKAPKNIAAAVLKEQQKDADGKLAGWNKYAFQGKEIVEASRDVRAFDLAATTAAADILKRCADAEPALKEPVRKTLDGLKEYAAKHLLDDSGALYTDETHKAKAMNVQKTAFDQAVSL